MSLVIRGSGWVREHPYAVSTLILVVLFATIIGINREQDERERREDAVERVDLAEHDARIECTNANQSRHLIRDIGVELALANAEALIAVVDDVEQEVIERYRVEAATRAEATVSVLADRDCVAEAWDARVAAAKVEGIDP